MKKKAPAHKQEGGRDVVVGRGREASHSSRLCARGGEGGGPVAANVVKRANHPSLVSVAIAQSHDDGVGSCSNGSNDRGSNAAARPYKVLLPPLTLGAQLRIRLDEYVGGGHCYNK